MAYSNVINILQVFVKNDNIISTSSVNVYIITEKSMAADIR